jgi:ATP-dependent helicase/nuclease subunit B
MVKTEINRYLIACCGNQESASVRLQNLFRRLQRNAILLVQNLVQEFKQSSFYPAFFELPMGTKESENGAKTLEIPLTDGTKAQIYGIIDRVDLYEQDNEVYIRVVDYKTGVTEHRLEDVQYGINLQMFIYLFALWKNPPKVLKDRVKATENTAFLPAGVLYFSAKPPSIRSNVGFLSPEVYQEAMLIPRTGLLLDDDRVLEAMEHGLQNKFIPLDDGKKGIHLQNLEEFGVLYRQICDVVSNIATEMKNGVADATPNFHKNNCDYCSYQDICRKAKKSKKR